MSDQELTTAQQQEIDSASRQAQRSEPATHVKQWLQDVHVATLGTLGAKPDLSGFPVNSVVPFAIDSNGAPYVLIAHIAAHTQNLKKDTRCNLFIRQGIAKGDPQAQWRATLVGHMEMLVVESSPTARHLKPYQTAISEDEFIALKARYRERVPKSDSYFQTHDFNFWRLRDIKKVRYIAGFGRICWFDGHELLGREKTDELADVAAGAIEHMNDDHRDALELICRNLHGLEPNSIKMTGLDSRGFFCEIAAEPRLIYTSFGYEISRDSLRQAMIDVTVRARNAVSS
ncbi:MAG: DUF2470 domain-containing protein [Myxococcota bacterium]|nr:DUF2470 domain-containing protein [Myxococcota bacterium]